MPPFFQHYPGWWFQKNCLSPPTWGNDPIWRAYFSNELVQPPTSILPYYPCMVRRVQITGERCELQHSIECLGQSQSMATLVTWVAVKVMKHLPNFPHFCNEKRASRYLGDLLGLKSYPDCVGIKANHYKDPYSTTRIQWKVIRDMFHSSHVFCAISGHNFWHYPIWLGFIKYLGNS